MGRSKPLVAERGGGTSTESGSLDTCLQLVRQTKRIRLRLELSIDMSDPRLSAYRQGQIS